MSKNPNHDWLLEGCHHITDVAVVYFPNYSYTTSAVKAMRRTITEHALLLQELTAEGYTPKTLHLTPKQIDVIVRFWGMPDHVKVAVDKNPYLAVPKKYGKI
ncbi:DUF4248 domain-containing protein [Bacteroides sp. GD17]|jgi:hypothetical protein|uniref:DUF4248 domain-containing protein n=1 Tax=Bacteroides sp. GD17 TaxID=3139826 RepID=UPI0025F5C796|nr:DUF4248 domain-containing protein [uncultured Bacteroides sp.]